jgi:polyadenylate-binding protein
VSYASPEQARVAEEALHGRELIDPGADDGEDHHCSLYVQRAMKKRERLRKLEESRRQKAEENARKYRGRNLILRNLDESVTEDDLRQKFSEFGTVESVRIPLDKESRSKLHGFVCLASPEEASRAMHASQRQMLKGKPIYVALWQPRHVRKPQLQQYYAQLQQQQMQQQYPTAAAATMQHGWPAAATGTYASQYEQQMAMSAAGVAYATAGAQVAPAARGGGAATRAGAWRSAPPSGVYSQGVAPTTAPAETARTELRDLLPQLAHMSEMERKQRIGPFLYAKVEESHPHVAAKVTGMLLQAADTEALLNLMETPEQLREQVERAVAVLSKQAQ